MISVRTALLWPAAALVFVLATSSANAISPCCGVHDYEVDGVKVALMSVQRDNPNEITVRWQLRNTTAAPVTVGESFGGSGSSEAYSLVWESYVLDPVGRVKYPILKDDSGTPVAARHGGSKAVTLVGNKTLSLWAKFEVPAQAAKLSVYLPGTEPFENVAVAATSVQTVSPAKAGSHDYEVDGVQAALTAVQRDDPQTITVRWQLRNTTAKPVTVGESFGGSGSSEAYSLVWDAYVVDAAARIKYSVLKDSEGTPMAARHGGSKAVTLAGNKTLSLWAKFEVPAQAAKLSVYLPGTEPFENVAVAPR
jgi:hypothetical protein